MHLQLAIAQVRAQAPRVLSGLSKIHGGGEVSAATPVVDSAAEAPRLAKPVLSTSPSSSTSLGPWAVPTLFDDDDGLDDAILDTRAKVQQAVQAFLDDELAASTIKTYDSVLREVAEAEAHLQMDILPMVDEQQFLALFGHFLHEHQGVVKWSRFRTLKAALVHWHRRRYTKTILDA